MPILSVFFGIVIRMWHDDHPPLSDGTKGVFDGNMLFQHQGSLLEPIKDENYFRKVYIEAGALSWPHGLELSPASLWSKCRHSPTQDTFEVSVQSQGNAGLVTENQI